MAESKKTEKVSLKVLLLYSIFLYGTWSLVHFFIEPFIKSKVNDVVSELFMSGLLKNLIWTLPAVILICKYNDSLYVGLKKMFTPNKDCIKYLWVFPATVAYIILGKVVKGGDFSIVDTFGMAKIIVVLFVGITEEIVFRGWLLNSTLHIGENKALAINAAMFLAIHFPTWIVSGVFVRNIVSFGFVSIIALSVIFGLLFIRTKNILIPIVLHMVWDLLLFMWY